MRFHWPTELLGLCSGRSRYWGIGVLGLSPWISATGTESLWFAPDDHIFLKRTLGIGHDTRGRIASRFLSVRIAEASKARLRSPESVSCASRADRFAKNWAFVCISLFRDAANSQLPEIGCGFWLLAYLVPAAPTRKVGAEGPATRQPPRPAAPRRCATRCATSRRRAGCAHTPPTGAGPHRTHRAVPRTRPRHADD